MLMEESQNDIVFEINSMLNSFNLQGNHQINVNKIANTISIIFKMYKIS